MITLSRRAPRWLILIMASLVILTITAVVPAARAAGAAPTWQAWGLTVDFPNQKLRAIYTAYVGTNNPAPTVVSSKATDISAKCTIVSPTGQLAFAGDYAIFDGSTYVKCTLPSWRNQIAALAPGLPAANQASCNCTPGGSPFFVGADLKLNTGAFPNPVFDARQLGFTFSTPSNGSTAQTRVKLNSATYSSQAWTILPQLGNRMVMGMRGRATVAVANHFNWLEFLTAPNWETWFTNNVTGARMGHWVEPSMTTRRMAATPYQLQTRSAVVHIGLDPATGDKLRGKLRKLDVDPGCFTGQ